MAAFADFGRRFEHRVLQLQAQIGGTMAFNTGDAAVRAQQAELSL